MEKWDDLRIDFLLTLRAKGLPFESIAGALRRYQKMDVTADELRLAWKSLLIGLTPYDGRPNNSMDRYDWTAREIKRLRIMKKNNVSLKRARQILCRSA